ncbi:MAG: hypothetical protein ACOC5J_03320 [Gemmatimonadota bacterium]
MSVFEHVGVAISIILGLGVTTLLTAGLDLFRHRGSTRFHWVLPTWAMLIFWLHLQFWWALGLLGQVGEWSHGNFLLTIAVAVSLFAAASLILPSRASTDVDDLATFFRQEGKWGCAATAVVYLLLIPSLNSLWGLPLISLASLAAAANVVVISVMLFARSQLLINVLTIAAICVQLVFQQFTFVPILSL